MANITKKKNNTFAVFIISHKRAESLLTLKSLYEANYSGDIYIIVDDQDEQLEIYKEKYGDKVIVFSKQEMYKKTDTVDNFNKLESAVYSRNFCFELAKKLDIEYFLLIDDDIQHFQIRYVKNGKLKGKRVKDFDKVLELLIELLKIENIACISFGSEGGFIGGASGKFSKGVGRTCCAATILKSKEDITYNGTQNEDFNICVKYSVFGKMFFEIYSTSIMSPKRNSNKGGIDYQKNGNMYRSNFYSVIVAPNCCKIGVKGNDFILRKNWNAFAPKIINERWKK